MTDERDAAIGRAVHRLVDVAARDETLRAGLEALARVILGLDEASLALADQAAEPDRDPEPETVAPAASDPAAVDSSALETDTEQTLPPESRTHEPVEPMNHASFMKLMEEVARQVEPSDLGSVAASLRGAAGVPGTPAPDGAGRDAQALPIVDADAGTRAPTSVERDAVLPGIAERTRLKAELAHAVAGHARTGTPIDEQLVHRARSAHCALWVLEADFRARLRSRMRATCQTSASADSPVKPILPAARSPCVWDPRPARGPGRSAP